MVFIKGFFSYTASIITNQADYTTLKSTLMVFYMFMVQFVYEDNKTLWVRGLSVPVVIDMYTVIGQIQLQNTSFWFLLNTLWFIMFLFNG